jgi:CO/xanthine dehydrogenase FAD-binding subunit
MRTAISSLTLKRPRTLTEALAMMRDEGPMTPLAGCTDVYVNLQFGTARGRKYLDLWPLGELRGIDASKTTLRIGALTTYTELIDSPIVRRRVPMLVAAAREIGGRQIQNRGTLGGNIANASPAGDALPVLLAADATIMLIGADGERRVPFASFYTGYRASVRRADELIAAIEIPRIDGKQWWRKVGTRRAQAISKVMMAGVRGSREVRLAVGSVAPTVRRLPKTEQALSSGASIAEAARVLVAEIAPIDDIRSTADYRRRVTPNLLDKFWRDTA